MRMQQVNITLQTHMWHRVFKLSFPRLRRVVVCSQLDGKRVACNDLVVWLGLHQGAHLVESGDWLDVVAVGKHYVNTCHGRSQT